MTMMLWLRLTFDLPATLDVLEIKKLCSKTTNKVTRMLSIEATCIAYAAAEIDPESNLTRHRIADVIL